MEGPARGWPLAWLVVALLAPLAFATSPLGGWEGQASLDTPPLVGRAVNLTVEIRANDRVTGDLHLLLPDWVVASPAGPRTIDVSAGSRGSATWEVTPTREGYWSALGRIYHGEDKAGWTGWCCLLARSTSEGGAWLGGGDTWERDARSELVPALDATASFTAALEDRTLHWWYEVRPQQPWPVGVVLSAGFDETAQGFDGSGTVVAQGTMQVPDPNMSFSRRAGAFAVVAFEGHFAVHGERELARACIDTQLHVHEGTLDVQRQACPPPNPNAAMPVVPVARNVTHATPAPFEEPAEVDEPGPAEPAAPASVGALPDADAQEVRIVADPPPRTSPSPAGAATAREIPVAPLASTVAMLTIAAALGRRKG